MRSKPTGIQTNHPPACDAPRGCQWNRRLLERTGRSFWLKSSRPHTARSPRAAGCLLSPACSPFPQLRGLLGIPGLGRLRVWPQCSFCPGPGALRERGSRRVHGREKGQDFGEPGGEQFWPPQAGYNIPRKVSGSSGRTTSLTGGRR